MQKLKSAIDENKDKDAVKVIDDTCDKLTGKHRKICSNIGALPNSPTRVVNDVARQLQSLIPADKICQKLAVNDPQICEIMHQFVPSHDADFKKMSVKQLKQTLAFMGVECIGCIDKGDFVEMAEKNRDKIPRTELGTTSEKTKIEDANGTTFARFQCASAPDLEDIIGDSDEENQELFGLLGQQRGPEATESVTLPELIKRFKKIWQNEKLSPELMTVQTDVVSLIARELNAFEQQITAQPRGELKTQLMRLQAERLRYLITDYLRVRIKKIEQYYHYVIMEERARPQSEEPHLSPAEFNFAKTLDNAILNNLRSVVLNNLPVNMRKIDPDAIAIRPNLDSYVFCQIKSRVEIAEPGIEQRASNLSTNMLTLLPGEIHLLPYRAIRQQTEDGAVILL
ncbi:hypothetical protein Aperf_G00000120766 [Anoplocephala perfoliata]